MNYNDMEHEDFVTLEQAKKLKELGFDWETSHIWVIFGENEHFERIETFKGAGLFKLCDESYPAPTVNQVKKWFREVHGIDIDIDSVYHRLDTGNKIMYGLRIGNQKTFKKEFYLNYDSYDEALSTGINHALKIIKQ